MKINKTLLLLFYLLAGVVAGNLLSQLLAGVPFLNWLSYYSEIGFDPFMLDLAVINFTFGMNMGITVAQIITIAIALAIFRKTSGKY